MKHSDMEPASNLSKGLKDLRENLKKLKAGEPVSINRIYLSCASTQKPVISIDVSEQTMVEDILKILRKSVRDQIDASKTQLVALGVEIDDPEE
jgi:riboflavin synthase alpha subunit